MLDLVGIDDVDPAAVLAEGRALETWEQMVRAQGGDPHAPLPRAGEIEIVPAPSTGTLSKLDAMSVGVAAWRLGAGRARKEDPVSAVAGVVWRATVGDEVREGEPLLERSEEHTSELQSLMRISYAGFCLSTQKQNNRH